MNRSLGKNFTCRAWVRKADEFDAAVFWAMAGRKFRTLRNEGCGTREWPERNRLGNGNLNAGAVDPHRK